MKYFNDGDFVEINPEYFRALNKPYKKIVGYVVETKKELVSFRKQCCLEIVFLHQTWFQRERSGNCIVCDEEKGIERRKGDRRKT